MEPSDIDARLDTFSAFWQVRELSILVGPSSEMAPDALGAMTTEPRVAHEDMEVASAWEYIVFVVSEQPGDA